MLLLSRWRPYRPVVRSTTISDTPSMEEYSGFNSSHFTTLPTRYSPRKTSNTTNRMVEVCRLIDGGVVVVLLRDVTRRYTALHGVTRRYTALHVVTRRYTTFT